MKTLYSPRCAHTGEPRTALTPETVKSLLALGLEVTVQPGLGIPAGFPDEAYTAAGATLIDDDATACSRADIFISPLPPTAAQLSALRPGTLVVSFLNPFHSPGTLQALADAGLSAISLECIPRSTLAQSMDALSSQASIAGYAAVILAARELGRLFPMMMTPSGTIQPARCLIVGAGVAGLQAIATAKRLGARVEACDTRSTAAEQVRSLGARFLSLDIGDSGQTTQGYARELSPEQIAAQRQLLAKACTKADIVITTAKVFGRPAPLLIDSEALTQMKPGSLIIDLAVETGGNVSGSIADQEVTTPGGVRILAPLKAENLFPGDASRMLAVNFANLLTHAHAHLMAHPDEPQSDPILAAAMLVHRGTILHSPPS